jgi:hypothetical protein
LVESLRRHLRQCRLCVRLLPPTTLFMCIWQQSSSVRGADTRTVCKRRCTLTRRQGEEVVVTDAGRERPHWTGFFRMNCFQRLDGEEEWRVRRWRDDFFLAVQLPLEPSPRTYS